MRTPNPHAATPPRITPPRTQLNAVLSAQLRGNRGLSQAAPPATGTEPAAYDPINRVPLGETEPPAQKPITSAKSAARSLAVPQHLPVSRQPLRQGFVLDLLHRHARVDRLASRRRRRLAQDH